MALFATRIRAKALTLLVPAVVSVLSAHGKTLEEPVQADREYRHSLLSALKCMSRLYGVNALSGQYALVIP